MAKSYKITIQLGGAESQGATEAVAGVNSPSASASAEASVPPSGGDNVLSKKYLTGMFAYRTIKSFVVQQINYQVSTTALRTGSNELQQRAEFQNQLIQKGVGILESTVIGLKLGSLPGALIGLSLSTAHTLIGYGQNQNTLNMQKVLENRSLELTRIRAGAQNSRSNNQ